MPLWKCPKCGDHEQLHVIATTTVRLLQDLSDTDWFETEDDGGHEWDSDSHMWCHTCGWRGEVRDAVVEESEDE